MGGSATSTTPGGAFNPQAEVDQQQKQRQQTLPPLIVRKLKVNALHRVLDHWRKELGA